DRREECPTGPRVPAVRYRTTRRRPRRRVARRADTRSADIRERDVRGGSAVRALEQKYQKEGERGAPLPRSDASELELEAELEPPLAVAGRHAVTRAGVAPERRHLRERADVVLGSIGVQVRVVEQVVELESKLDSLLAAKAE